MLWSTVIRVRTCDVNSNDYLSSFRADGARILSIADGDLGAPVPCCEGWTLGDLVGHVSMVLTMINTVVETGAPPAERPIVPEGPGVAAACAEAFSRLDATLAATDPDTEGWNWSSGPQQAAFWFRRVAHELAIHRWDAEAVIGDCRPIDPVLASDGIDEWFDVFLRRGAGRSVTPINPGGTIHIHCTDTEGEWWAAMTDSEVELEREHKKGDVVARGGASDLLLVLWGRQDPSAVEVLGDAPVLDAWIAAAGG